MKLLPSCLTFAFACLPAHAVLTVVESNVFVGPDSTAITTNISTTAFPGFIDFDGVGFTVNDSANRAIPGQLNAADAAFGEDRLFFRAGEAAGVPDPAGTRTGVVGPSTMFIGVSSADFYLLVREGTAMTGFLNGAQMGDDNWVYFSNNDNAGNEKTSFWAQINLTETAATPVRYVYDPADPTADIIFSDAITAVDNVPEPSSVVLLLLGTGTLVLRRKK